MLIESLRKAFESKKTAVIESTEIDSSNLEPKQIIALKRFATRDIEDLTEQDLIQIKEILTQAPNLTSAFAHLFGKLKASVLLNEIIIVTRTISDDLESSSSTTYEMKDIDHSLEVLTFHLMSICIFDE